MTNCYNGGSLVFYVVNIIGMVGIFQIYRIRFHVLQNVISSNGYYPLHVIAGLPKTDRNFVHQLPQEGDTVHYNDDP